MENLLNILEISEFSLKKTFYIESIKIAVIVKKAMIF